MTDLHDVVPTLDVKPFSHIIPSLEKALVTTSDLLTIEALDLAKRAQVPLAEVKRLADLVLRSLHGHIRAKRDEEDEFWSGATEEHGGNGEQAAGIFKVATHSCISTLDDVLDAGLGGGFPVTYLSEITGESAAGKTQLLLSLLLAVQLPSPHGLSKSALYISTEAPLQTTRLTQISNQHPYLSRLDAASRPTLSRIHGIKVGDLESQEHILRFQVPVAIQRNNIGLVVIDSIAANFRAEFDRGSNQKSADAFAKRSRQLVDLGALLRDIARTYNVAIVVANQVLDRFTPADSVHEYASQPGSQRRDQVMHHDRSKLTSAYSTPPPPPPSTQLAAAPRPMASPSTVQPQPHQVPSQPSRQPQPQPQLSNVDPLALDHQQRFFTGWGDRPPTHAASRNLKTPSLGVTWTNQLAARIVLLKTPVYKAQDYVLGPELEIAGWRRSVKVAFAKWCADDNGCDGTPFEIWEGGVRGIGDAKDGE